jgi:hypothetical protein
MVKSQVINNAGTTVKTGKSGSVASQTKQPWFFSKGFILLWFAIAGFVLFGQTIGFDYTYLDDQTLILNNIGKLSQGSYIQKAFTEDVFHSGTGNGYYYRPVLTLTFMADAMAGNGKFSMFHFSNIVYHILATFLLFLFFIETGSDRIRSFLFSLIFLVHPMITQVVAWVPGRNDSLLAIFVLSSFIFWLKYLKTNQSRYLFLHLFLFVVALLTKENAIVLPVLIVLFSSMTQRTPLRKYFIPGASWAIILVIWAIIRFRALGGETQVSFLLQVSSMFGNLPALLPFLGKMIFPFSLSVFPVLADMKISIVLGLVAIGVLVALIGVSKPKQWFLYFFGIFWFFAFLVPSFITVNKSVPDFSEHRAYLSLAGILILVMASGPVKNANFTKIIPLSTTAVFILFFGILTFLHSRNFRDNFSFWQNAVDTSPSNAFNHNNLGAMYYLAGNHEQAELYFRKALKINPYEPLANSNTGLVCMNSKRPAEAEKYYLEEIRINPSYDHAYYNLGLLYFNNSRPGEAVVQWEKTLEVNPYYIDAYKALLFAYEKMERKEDYQRIVTLGRLKGVLQ